MTRARDQFDSDIVTPGVLVVEDEIYLHAADLIDYFNGKGTAAYRYGDFSMYEQFDNCAREISDIVEGQLS